MRINSTLIFCLFVLGLCLIPAPASAMHEEDAIILSEFAPIVVEDDKPWVELYNLSDRYIDLTKWSLQSKGQSIEIKGFINPHQYLVFTFKEPFKNAPEQLILRNHSNTIIDEWTTNKNPISEQSLLIEEGSVIVSSHPTAGRPNIQSEIPSPSPTPQPQLQTAPIQLTEVFANPDGDETSQEFIELFNPTNELITLTSWTISDLAKSFNLSEFQIAAKSYLVVKRTDSSIALNNSSESITLIDPFDIVIDQFSYESTSDGLSWNKEDQWYEAQPSPGNTNTLPPALNQEESNSNEIQESLPTESNAIKETNSPTNETESSSIESEVSPISQNDQETSIDKVDSDTTQTPTSFADWPTLLNDDQVIITGTISVPPGTFAKREAIIQSEEHFGITLYLHQANWPSLSFGDIVQITGRKSITTRGDRLIIKNPTDIFLKDTSSFIPPEYTSLSENLVVSIKGTLIEQRKNELLIDTDNQELIINLSKGSIQLSEIIPESTVTITGLLRTSEIWPRMHTDISSADPPGLQEEVPISGAITEATELPPPAIQPSTSWRSKTYVLPITSFLSALLGYGFALRKTYLAKLQDYLKTLPSLNPTKYDNQTNNA